MKKILITIVATVLVCACIVGGTLAWLTDETTEIKNTFTVGDIEIELAETEATYKIVPGNEISKDPKVTVKADSEKCYLFVKITKSTNFDTYFENLSIAEGWTVLSGVTDIVYYRVVESNTSDVSFNVLGEGTNDTTANPNGCVQVRTTVTADQLETAETSQPTLAFQAYAVQFDNVADAATAWGIATGTN